MTRTTPRIYRFSFHINLRNEITAIGKREHAPQVFWILSVSYNSKLFRILRQRLWAPFENQYELRKMNLQRRLRLFESPSMASGVESILVGPSNKLVAPPEIVGK